MSKPIGELIDHVQGALLQVEQHRRALEDARRAHSRSEIELHNAQNELGKALQAAGVVGSDYRIVSSTDVPEPVRAHVFGVDRARP